MLDNLKINLSGQAEIIDLFAWMDGGTITVILANKDNSTLEIEFTQHADLKVSDLNPNPGRLLLNKKIVDVRSDLEAKIISVLKKSRCSDKLSQKCLDDAINFVESRQYILLAK